MIYNAFLLIDFYRILIVQWCMGVKYRHTYIYLNKLVFDICKFISFSWFPHFIARHEKQNDCLNQNSSAHCLNAHRIDNERVRATALSQPWYVKIANHNFSFVFHNLAFKKMLWLLFTLFAKNIRNVCESESQYTAAQRTFYIYNLNFDKPKIHIK